MYTLQNRWKAEGSQLIYYGLRNRDRLFDNCRKLTAAQRDIIAALPCELTQRQLRILGPLVGECVVPAELRRTTPKSLRDARFCTNCCANDYMIPGLEFDEEGLCPLCQTQEDTRDLKSLVPLVRDIPRAENSRFDIALFYTGGKDSTFLLYYLSKVKNLRVLALTWEIPFMSESARRSMENARRHFANVEFITRWVNEADLKAFYSRLYALSENTCACPSLAYVLFYPELVANRVPYFTAGNEPAQALGLYYNHMAPKLLYTLSQKRWPLRLYNIGRVLTLQPPLKPGQLHTLTTMRHLAKKPRNNAALYPNELVNHIAEALQEIPDILMPLRRSLRHSSRTGHIPAFVQFDLDEISGGRYDWKTTKETIARQCGWVGPEVPDKALHTSCSIEKCKEYSQFTRFYHCRSRMIPFSALEMALASRGKNLSREAAIQEVEQALGFSLEEIPECAIMHRYLEDRV